MAYVLAQETDEYLLWNPLTGKCHKQFDPFCPLQSVDCLFDDRNVSIWGRNLILHYFLMNQTSGLLLWLYNIIMWGTLKLI